MDNRPGICFQGRPSAFLQVADFEGIHTVYQVARQAAQLKIARLKVIKFSLQRHNKKLMQIHTFC